MSAVRTRKRLHLLAAFYAPPEGWHVQRSGAGGKSLVWRQDDLPVPSWAKAGHVRYPGDTYTRRVSIHLGSVEAKPVLSLAEAPWLPVRQSIVTLERALEVLADPATAGAPAGGHA